MDIGLCYFDNCGVADYQCTSILNATQSQRI